MYKTLEQPLVISRTNSIIIEREIYFHEDSGHTVIRDTTYTPNYEIIKIRMAFLTSYGAVILGHRYNQIVFKSGISKTNLSSDQLEQYNKDCEYFLLDPDNPVKRVN